MKCGVVTFPGSNCNHDMIYALGKTLEQEVVELWHKDQDTKNCDLIVLPGGFSYELQNIFKSTKALLNEFMKRVQGSIN